jgi:DNA anti-recombination protein RmuC
MYFRLYNKAAGSIISSNTQIVTNTPTIQQLTTQNITRNTTQPPINSSYNFIVRKDSHLMNRQMYDAYMFGVSQLNNAKLYKSRDYINTLLIEDTNIDKRIKEKVNSYDLTQNVTQIVENYNADNGIYNNSSLNQAIQNAINILQEEKQKLLHDINIHSYQAISLMNQNMNNTIQNINNSVNNTLQTALSSINTNTNSLNNTISNINVNLNNSLQQAVTIFNTNNSSLNTKLDEALASIDNKTQQALDEIIASGNSSSTINNALQEALTTINTGKQQALTQINISAYNAISNISNMVDDDSFVYEIKNELLQKIDYIFEMFFHANSNIIMNNYPL